MYIKTTCPECGAEMRVLVDMPVGPPDEAYATCKACGKTPMWKFIWWVDGKLGEYLGDADARNEAEAPTHVA